MVCCNLTRKMKKTQEFGNKAGESTTVQWTLIADEGKIACGERSQGERVGVCGLNCECLPQVRDLERWLR